MPAVFLDVVYVSLLPIHWPELALVADVDGLYPGGSKIIVDDLEVALRKHDRRVISFATKGAHTSNALLAHVLLTRRSVAIDAELAIAAKGMYEAVPCTMSEVPHHVE